MWSARGSYPHETVENLLQRGELRGALQKGWFGDEFTYRLVRAYGLPRLRVAVDGGVDLGLDLRNHEGVATVGAIGPGAIAQDGLLRSGDVIRAIDGVTLFTCEAVVSAIKAARSKRGKRSSRSIRFRSSRALQVTSASTSRSGVATTRAPSRRR